jgi:L-serine dehydratase
MISVFDMFSVGIGPSSSHTVGPMRAAHSFVQQLKMSGQLTQIDMVNIELYGSLGQTGKGHGTGKAVILGLLGELPESINVETIDDRLKTIEENESIDLNNEHNIPFPKTNAIIFHRKKTLEAHSNGLTLSAFAKGEQLAIETYFSVGGGFIIKAQDMAQQVAIQQEQANQYQPYPFDSANQLLQHCHQTGKSISRLMMDNEKTTLAEQAITTRLMDIWQIMQGSIKRGIQTEGILPGGLKVKRRAPTLFQRLQTEQSADPMAAMDWVNLFALAVNEENAAGGRVVTAPTNGAAGIIPAVLGYFDKFIRPVDEHIASRFLLTAGAIGILYKKNASISGAEVGCQGEVGVACSMAAGALTEIMGGSPNAVENAAEIGMEHNLGLTCDPVGGLVQVPCIERNAMGAIKAINASRLAMRGTGDHKVSLDKVIKTMRETGNDMKSKYKETARGGLAVNIIEC